MNHWFDELAKRASKGGARRAGAEPELRAGGSTRPVVPGEGLFTRRNILAGASAFGLSAVVGTRGLGHWAPNPAVAQNLGGGNCFAASQCIERAYKANKDDVKSACGSPYAGYSDNIKDGEAGFKLGCVAFHSAILIQRLESCAKICPCPTGQTQCNGTCVDLHTDNNNCGQCDKNCVAPSTCQNGHCATCDPPCSTGETCCSRASGPFCTSLQIDDFNCGACGNVCGGTFCRDGRCDCDTCNSFEGPRLRPKNPYSKVCDTGGGQLVCIDTSFDTDNCGACGNRCPNFIGGFLACCSCGTCVQCGWPGLGGRWNCETGTCPPLA